MDQQSVRVDAVGEERQPVVVVEGFAPDPERLIADAETVRFQPMGAYYPGVRAPVPPHYFEGLAPVLAPIMREVFGASDRIAFRRALFSIAATPPGELALAQRIPHIDGVEEGMIAIVHYLSRRDQGGTAFYRHRSTGFETVDAARHRTYLDALREEFRAHGEPPAAYISGDTAQFQQTARYDAVFNRAIIYRSSLLHCASLNGPLPPPTPREGRLTVASFLSIA